MENLATELPGQNLSLFLTIWYKPRSTIRQILDSNSDRYVAILVGIFGILRALEQASERNMGDTLPLVGTLVLVLLVGPLGGYITVYIFGAVYRWTGSWVGGKANSKEIRTALAWAYVPGILSLFLWIIKLVLFGEEMFTKATPRLDSSILLSIIFLGLLFIDIIISIWTLFLMVKCISEAHRFSAWKGLVTIFLGLLIIAVPIFAIAVILSGFYWTL